MHHDEEYGRPNPNAPGELSHFAFLIGRWRCDVRVRGNDDAWQRYEATWTGRYILDGYVIADEYRMTDADGHLIVHGMNFRAYDTAERAGATSWSSRRIASDDFAALRHDSRRHRATLLNA